MGETITALCYIHGAIIDGASGIEYNRRPEKAIRMKYGMTYEALMYKLHRIFHIDSSRNKLIITYRYPQVLDPTVVTYVPIPITDDEDMEMLLSTINSHPYRLAAELFIDVQPLEYDTHHGQEMDEYEAVVHSIATTHVSENVIPYCT